MRNIFEKKIAKDEKREFLGRVKKSLREKNRNAAVNMLQDGVAVGIIATITACSEGEILEIKDLMDVGYGYSVFDIEYARKLKVAKSMIGEGIPVGIVKAVSKLTETEVLSLEG